MNGHDFMVATPAERLSLLERLDRQQYEYMQAWKDTEPVHYFRMVKELALLGYFTSEIGYKQALRYVETPGRYEPCVPYTPGDEAWAPHA
jgi:Gluconate 2-dehydrogenase subunit 3